MINLIGPNRKKQIRAARRNSIWMRYIFLLVSTGVAIFIILGGASFYFYSQKLAQDAKIKANQEKSYTTEYKTSKAAVDNFSKNLKTAKTVFDAETYYSDIILDIAKTTPANTILGNIKFDSTTFDAQQTLEFRAKTVDAALALKTAFEKNPPLSSEVRFSQITKPEEGKPVDSPYPVQISMFMKLKKPTSSLGSSTSKTGVGG